MKYKVGQDLYTLQVNDDGSCAIETYRVKTIRGGKVYAALFLSGVTWGKLSSKHGDFGWLEPIDPLFREMTPEGTPFRNLHTTKRQAWLSKCNTSWLDPNDPDDKIIFDKVTKTTQSVISRIDSKRKEHHHGRN